MFENECKVVHCSVGLSFEEEVELEATLQPCLCSVYLCIYHLIVSPCSEDKESKTVLYWSCGIKIPVSYACQAGRKMWENV